MKNCLRVCNSINKCSSVLLSYFELPTFNCFQNNGGKSCRYLSRNRNSTFLTHLTLKLERLLQSLHYRMEGRSCGRLRKNLGQVPLLLSKILYNYFQYLFGKERKRFKQTTRNTLTTKTNARKSFIPTRFNFKEMQKNAKSDNRTNKSLSASLSFKNLFKKKKKL